MERKTVEMAKTSINSEPTIEKEMMLLVIDSYLKGSQTKTLSDGQSIGVSIYQGPKEFVHLFINQAHKLTVEIYHGRAEVTGIKQIEREDVAYILPFTKCLGISEQRALESLY
jgi:hypothetical protein